METNTQEQSAKEITTIALYGDTKQFYAPSGYSYTIQEQNGDHDALLSNVGSSMAGDNYDNFVASIVIKTDFTTHGKLTIKEAGNLPSLDFAFIILQSRLHSLGDEIKFTFEWEAGKPIQYVDNLQQYLPDYKAHSDDELANLFMKNKLACPMYPERDKQVIEFTTLQQNKFRFSICTRNMEKKLLELAQEDLTINTKLSIRNLEQLQKDGEWIKVQSFKFIKAKEMRVIRGYLEKFDPNFNAVSEITNPKDNQKHTISFLELPDFFFPAEI